MKKTHKAKSLLIKEKPMEYESVIDNCKKSHSNFDFLKAIFLFMPDVANSISSFNGVFYQHLFIRH